MTTHQYLIKGMHCASCNVFVKMKLEELPQIKEVQVDRAKGLLNVEQSDDVKIADMNAVLTPHGYTVETYDSHISASSSRRYDIVQILQVVLVCIVFGIIVQKLGLMQIANSFTSLNFFTALILGLIASLSSCAATTGVLFLHALGPVPQTKRTSFVIQFIGGRVLSYLLFGFVFGYFATQASGLFGYMRYLSMGVGVLMVLLGLDTLGIVSIPNPVTWIFAARKKTTLPAYITGALTYFLPCGFTISTQLYALTTGSGLQSALIMGGFAIGTIPALFAMSLLQRIKSPSFTLYFGICIGVVMVGIGTITIVNAYSLF